MLSDESSHQVPSRISRNGAPPPAPFGNKRALGNKGNRQDFLTKTLISQLHEVVTREVPVLQIVQKGKGKPQKRWIISKKTHEKIHFLVEALLENAMNGETDAIKYVFDRIEGRPMSTFPAEEGDRVLTVHFVPQDNRI